MRFTTNKDAHWHSCERDLREHGAQRMKWGSIQPIARTFICSGDHKLSTIFGSKMASAWCQLKKKSLMSESKLNFKENTR